MKLYVASLVLLAIITSKELDKFFGYALFIDVDECLTNNGGCNQTCTNTIASFECSCGTGYILASNDLDCDGRNFKKNIDASTYPSIMIFRCG